MNKQLTAIIQREITRSWADLQGRLPRYAQLVCPRHLSRNLLTMVVRYWHDPHCDPVEAKAESG